MERIIALIIGYLMGNIQTAYLITKYVAKIDIREQGSGNAGATNVLRTLGFKYGLTVLILDILKGFLACLVVSIVLTPTFEMQYLVEGGATYVLPIYAGFGAVIGHNYPFVLQFKGGKGAATTLGTLIYINWIIGVGCFVLGLLIIKLKKYVSLGSIIGLCSSTIIFIILGYHNELLAISFILSLLTVYQHRENIKRLLNGTERKLGSSKK